VSRAVRFGGHGVSAKKKEFLKAGTSRQVVRTSPPWVYELVVSDTHREPSALYCWILEILYCTPKGRRALLRIPSTEGRSVCLCWEHSKPKGPKGRDTAGSSSSNIPVAPRDQEILDCTLKVRRALLRIPSMEGRSVCLCWAKSKPRGLEGQVLKVLLTKGSPSGNSSEAYLVMHPLPPLHDPLHRRAKRDLKAYTLSLQSFRRKGVSLGHVGRNQNFGARGATMRV